jgi:hypothetical protein
MLLVLKIGTRVAVRHNNACKINLQAAKIMLQYPND